MNEELFRFYAIRAPAPLDEEDTISLDTDSSQHATLAGTAPAARPQQASSLLAHGADTLVALFKSDAAPLRSVTDWVEESPEQCFDEAFRAKVASAFGTDFNPAARRLTGATRLKQIKDALVCVRILNPNAQALQRIIPVDAHQFAEFLVSSLRVAQLLSGSGSAFSHTVAQAAIHANLISTLFDTDSGSSTATPPPAKPSLQQRLTDAKAALADLSRLLIKLERACPHQLGLNVNVAPPSGAGTPAPTPIQRAGPALTLATAQVLEAEFAGLPKRVETALHDGVAPNWVFSSGWLFGTWIDVYEFYELKARDLQIVIDKLQLALDQSATPSAPASAQWATPIDAGYLRMAGMTDVKIVKTHVVRYETAEIAQIENVLKGESRSRRFRTLDRREEDTQSQTESQTTEEKEIKTEDKSTLKSSIDQVLKENLDLKVGFDLKAKVGDSVQIGLNTSFGYSRSSEETKKQSSDFAKDVTNRAARKVSETVRTSIETKILHETEESVGHTFDATGATAHIVGLYQWIEKVNCVQIYTAGDQARAVIDGVLLQPGQRLLTNPDQLSGKLNIPPPPELDVGPAGIYPWNYLSLCGRFGATGVPAPPPLTTNMSYSSAAPAGEDHGGEKDYGIAQDLALPDESAAAFASITLSGEIDVDLDHEHLLAALGSATWTLTGSAAGEQVQAADTDTRSIRQTRTLILQGEQRAIPFTFFGGRIPGYAVAVDITSIRSQASFEAWQLGVYAALRAAQLKSEQDYAEATQRAALETAYNVGPSPGEVDQIAREELKRIAISVLAKQNAAGSLYPDIDAFYAAGQYEEVAKRCLFFEHALEWENMTYILYPYYWADGRDDGWALHNNRSEKDADLIAFLRAGAARVVIPVRPLPKDVGTTLQDFGSYLSSMSLPSLPELIDVDSPLYLAIDAEIKARDGVEPLTFDEEWEVRVPTELVKLRADAKLPTWAERLDTANKPIKGDWVEEVV